MTSSKPATEQIGQRIYTVHEAALLLGLSVEAVRKHAERGKLTSIKYKDGTRHILLDLIRESPDLVQAITRQRLQRLCRTKSSKGRASRTQRRGSAAGGRLPKSHAAMITSLLPSPNSSLRQSPSQSCKIDPQTATSAAEG